MRLSICTLTRNWNYKLEFIVHFVGGHFGLISIREWPERYLSLMEISSLNEHLESPMPLEAYTEEFSIRPDLKNTRSIMEDKGQGATEELLLKLTASACILASNTSAAAVGLFIIPELQFWHAHRQLPTSPWTASGAASAFAGDAHLPH